MTAVYRRLLPSVRTLSRRYTTVNQEDALKKWSTDAATFKQTEHDLYDSRRLSQLNAMLPEFARTDLNRKDPDLTGLNLTLFNPVYNSENLGPDGTENGLNDPLTPTIDGENLERMWAGGSFSFRRDNPVKLDQKLRQTTTLDRFEVKKGRQGTNYFVWLDKTVENDAGVCLVEKRCRLFRPPGTSQKAQTGHRPEKKADPPSFDFSDSHTPNSIMLFRFSALTYNPHKIHYDLRYCRDVEGRQDLIVHGPLNATLLMRLIQKEATKRGQTLAEFNYRASKVAYVDRELTFGGTWTSENSCDLKVLDEQGDAVMTATARIH